MKRIIVASVIAVTVLAAGAAGTAGAASGPTSAVITFDDVAQQVTLQIPDPPCDVSEPNCVWKFFLNEPKLSVDVATIYGTSGTLTLPYPTDFCGIIQADAYVGPTANGPWVPKRGWQHPIQTGTCEPGSTTTSSMPTSPQSSVPTSSTTTTTDGPTTEAAAQPPVTPVVAAAAAAPTSTTTTTLPAKPAAAVTSLPFTGANLRPFVLLGGTLVALGLGLLVRRRKRTL